MIKNIVFDYGGVLVDWSPHYVFNDLFGSFSKAYWFMDNICTYEWNGQMDAGKTYDQGVAELVAKFPEWEEEIRTYQRRWGDMVHGAIPGMYEYVQELKSKGFKLYGLTNWSRETFPPVRKKFPVFELLDGMIVSGEEYLHKPQPEIYNLLLSRYNLKADECVFIDDLMHNVEGARAVGMHSIQFIDAGRLRKALDELIKREDSAK